MKPIDFVLIGIVAAALIAAVIKIIRNKKSGKCNCGCDCGSCSGCKKSD